MKVMFGSFSALTVLGGGVKVQVESLARELRAQGHEVELFDPWKEYRLADYDLFHLFAAHVGTYHLGRAIKTLGMRLCVSPVFFSRHPARRVAALVNLARRVRRQGGFWTEHMFCKELCDMADLVLPNTTAEADLVADAFATDRAKIRVVPNGVDSRFLDADPGLFREHHGLEGFILYVGHIGWGRKNVLPLLKVCAELGHPTVLIGPVIDNAYGRRCLELIERNDHITLLEPMPPGAEMLASAYAACDTLVLPAFYETPGLAALEAGLAGAKVCITRHGGTKDYFGELASYLEPTSEDSIRAALQESLAKPRDNRLRDHIRTEFLWGEAARKLARAYETLKAGASRDTPA
ncbi:glycosyltransferase family 4 protein [candidate division WOR-3 bacterium]|nr:glycosyltransferase family 4 protein [candidate division WOR-3 bacterium]